MFVGLAEVPLTSPTYSKQAARVARARRGRALTFMIGLLGIAAAIVAVLLEGSARANFGAVAIVLLITASYSAGIVWFETRDVVDIEEPPPVTPLPQSPVTEIYDPGSPPNNRLQRTGEE